MTRALPLVEAVREQILQRGRRRRGIDADEIETREVARRAIPRDAVELVRASVLTAAADRAVPTRVDRLVQPRAHEEGIVGQRSTLPAGNVGPWEAGLVAIGGGARNGGQWFSGRGRRCRGIRSET